MITGLNVLGRRLVISILVTAMVLIISVYGPVGLENALGLEFGSTVYAEHLSSGGG